MISQQGLVEILSRLNRIEAFLGFDMMTPPGYGSGQRYGRGRAVTGLASLPVTEPTFIHLTTVDGNEYKLVIPMAFNPPRATVNGRELPIEYIPVSDLLRMVLLLNDANETLSKELSSLKEATGFWKVGAE